MSIAFYATSDEKHAPFAIVSLLLARNKDQKIHLYLFGTHFSKRIRKICKKYDIDCVENDLRGKFSRVWGEKKVEDFYVFEGPEYAYKKGDEKAVHIDTKLVFDCKEMKEKQLLKTAVNLYQKAIKKGDPLRTPGAIIEQMGGATKNKIEHLGKEWDFIVDTQNMLNGLKRYIFPEWLKIKIHYYGIATRLNSTLWNIRDRKNQRKGLILDNKQRKENEEKEPIKTYWFDNDYCGIHNFGDEVTAELVPKIFGYRLEHVDPDKADLAAVGSIIEIMEDAGRKAKIWGSGFIKTKQGEDKLKNLNFYAVRGINTRTRVGLDVPVGDPGLLANVIYPFRPKKTDVVGIIAHYVDVDRPLVEKMRNDPRFTIINPLDPPKEVARQICQCKLILSSSLHGLIFADSYGIPNARLILSDEITGGDYKYDDYYSATGRSGLVVNSNKVTNTQYLNTLIKDYKKIENLEKIQKELIRVFPKF